MDGIESPDDERGHVLLRLTGITKQFGGNRAVDSVDLTLYESEVLALVGDNGAGKSTLVRIISGVEHADEGTIEMGGEHVKIDSIRAAAGHGIRTVYQDLALCDNLDTVQNLFLGQELTGRRWSGRLLRRLAMEKKAHEVLQSLSVKIKSVQTPTRNLSGGQRQGIAIGRAILANPKLIILDEPTAALGVSQRHEVLELIARLREQRRSVLVISHDMRDVQQVADRVIVMRLGRKVAEFTRGQFTPDQLIAAMTGSHEAAPQLNAST